MFEPLADENILNVHAWNTENDREILGLLGEEGVRKQGRVTYLKCQGN